MIVLWHRREMLTTVILPQIPITFDTFSQLSLARPPYRPSEKGPPTTPNYTSRDRRQEHRQRHFRGFAGILHADAYSDYNTLYDLSRTQGAITSELCWSPRETSVVRTGLHTPPMPGAADRRERSRPLLSKSSMEKARSASGPARIRAAIAHVFTIRRAAQILGETCRTSSSLRMASFG